MTAERLRSIEVLTDGVCEVIEFENDEHALEVMAALGWIRADLDPEESAEFAKHLTAAPKPIPGLAQLIKGAREPMSIVDAVGIPDLDTNGHAPIGTMASGESVYAEEPQPRVPLPELVNNYRAEAFPVAAARTSGDIALQLVSSLIHVLEAERKAGE